MSGLELVSINYMRSKKDAWPSCLVGSGLLSKRSWGEAATIRRTVKAEAQSCAVPDMLRDMSGHKSMRVSRY